MFTHSHKQLVPRTPVNRKDTSNIFRKPLIEGAGVIHSLCPVDPSTGCRDSIGQIMKRAVNDPVKARLVSQVLQELPSIVSDRRVKDDDKFDMIIEHFHAGTPAEADELRKNLAPFVNQLLQDAKAKKDYQSPQVQSSVSPAPVPASPEPSAAE